MFRSSIMLLATMLCVSCVSHRPIQDSSSPPIDAANPLDGTPVALAWSSGTQLMMGVDTGAVQTSLLFSPAVESIGARLRGRGAMRTANVPISLKDDGEPISRKQDVVMADQAPYDGLLGWECIRKYVWNINYPKRSHRFFNKLPSRIKSWNRLSLIPGSDYPQIADRHGRRIILDTGAPHAVYISKKRWNAIKQAYPDAFVSVYSGYSPAAGGFYAHECMHVSSFQLGPLELKNILLCESFANPEVMGIPDDIDIILGYGALAARQFWLDGPGNALYFSSTSHRMPAPASFNLMGGTFIQDSNGNGPMKAYVAEWSPGMGRRPQNGRCSYFHQWKKESLSGPRRICYHPAGGSGQRGGPAQEQAGAHPMGSSGRAPCRGLLPHAPGHYGTGIRKPRQAAGKKRTDPALRRRPAASGYGRRNSG